MKRLGKGLLDFLPDPKSRIQKLYEKNIDLEFEESPEEYIREVMNAATSVRYKPKRSQRKERRNAEEVAKKGMRNLKDYTFLCAELFDYAGFDTEVLQTTGNYKGWLLYIEKDEKSFVLDPSCHSDLGKLRDTDIYDKEAEACRNLDCEIDERGVKP